MLRNVRPDDATSISEIYNHYVEHTAISFEELPVSAAEMRTRIVTVTETLPWLVCEEDGELLGYCYAAQWKARSAYRYSAETTVYLRPSAIGRGKGTLLFNALMTELRERDIHTVIGGVALPNPPSVRLLEKFGLRQIAYFSQVGYKFGKWIDVGYWQVVL